MRYKKKYDEIGAKNGVDVALAGFYVDEIIAEAIGKIRNDIDKNFRRIARIAGEATKVDFSSFVQAATGTYLFEMTQFLSTQDRQIRNLRLTLTGNTDDIVAEPSAVPTYLASDSLVVLGGAMVDPQTNQPVRAEDGTYFVDNGPSIGLLYTGRKAMNVFSDSYFEVYGRMPNFRLTWVHTTPPGRALDGHRDLGGKSYTLAERPIVLRNDSVPWLGPQFHVQDHFGCGCCELPSLL